MVEPPRRPTPFCGRFVGLAWLLLLAQAGHAARLTYTFDDGAASQMRAYTVLSAYQQVGVIGTIARRIGNSANLSASQLLVLQNAGWEISSHSLTHPTFDFIPQRYTDELLTGWLPAPGSAYTYVAGYAFAEMPLLMQDRTELLKVGSLAAVDTTAGSYFLDTAAKRVYVQLTDQGDPGTREMRADSVQRELAQSRAELTQWGFDVQTFIVPKSQWSNDRAALATQYYAGAASAIVGKSLVAIPPVNPYWIKRAAVTDCSVSVDTVKGWITDAIDSDQWLILNFHQIGTSYCDSWWPVQSLDALAQWVAAQPIEVVTLRGGLDVPDPNPADTATAVQVPVLSAWGYVLLGFLLALLAFRETRSRRGRDRDDACRSG